MREGQIEIGTERKEERRSDIKRDKQTHISIDNKIDGQIKRDIWT